jgi:hypothetical protein
MDSGVSATRTQQRRLVGGLGTYTNSRSAAQNCCSLGDKRNFACTDRYIDACPNLSFHFRWLPKWPGLQASLLSGGDLIGEMASHMNKYSSDMRYNIVVRVFTSARTLSSGECMKGRVESAVMHDYTPCQHRQFGLKYSRESRPCLYQTHHSSEHTIEQLIQFTEPYSWYWYS